MKNLHEDLPSILVKIGVSDLPSVWGDGLATWICRAGTLELKLDFKPSVVGLVFQLFVALMEPLWRRYRKAVNARLGVVNF